MEQDPPEPAPIFEISIDQERGLRIGSDVFDAAQSMRRDRLRLGVDRLVHRVAE
jgi:hypothetical protein